MILAEKISRFIPDRVKLPIKPATFSELIEILEKEHPASVFLTPISSRIEKDDSSKKLPHYIYTYGVAYDAQTPKGRKITFHESFHEWDDVIIAGNDWELRQFRSQNNNNVLRTFLSALERRRAIAARLPEAEVIIAIRDTVAHQDWIEERKEIATARSLTPWESQ